MAKNKKKETDKDPRRVAHGKKMAARNFTREVCAKGSKRQKELYAEELEHWGRAGYWAVLEKYGAKIANKMAFGINLSQAEYNRLKREGMPLPKKPRRSKNE